MSRFSDDSNGRVTLGGVDNPDTGEHCILIEVSSVDDQGNPTFSRVLLTLTGAELLASAIQKNVAFFREGGQSS